MCAYVYVDISVFRQVKFCFVSLNIWYREVPFLWWTVDLDTEMRKAMHSGGYLRLELQCVWDHKILT